MPSITYWSRLEPRPRAPSITEPLAARVRDPLWLLARQWQVEEFRGSDGGSPAFTQLSASFGSVLGWRADDGELHPTPAGYPLEELVESEPFSPDLALRVELGQTFAALLADAGIDDDIETDFRSAYPVERATEEELAAMPDRETARMLRVCGGRSIDGIALYRAAQPVLPALPAEPAIPGSAVGDVRDALVAFVDWVEAVVGPPGTDDPASWTPERLEYRVDVVAASPDGTPVVLAASPGADGDFDWDALDLTDKAIALQVPDDAVSAVDRSVIPGNVRFRGMPNARWWSFESGATDFGSIVPDRRDLAKLVVMDFMLVHGNDWFLVPFDVPVGTLGRVDLLLVQDVFGELTLVGRADAGEADPGERWTMFSTATQGEPTRLADFYALPPSASVATQSGPVLEDVRFFRDELANMVWGIERATENGLGRPWPGHERDLARRASAPPDDSPSGLRYRIQTSVPEHWIPFLPVAIDPGRRDVALERSAMLRPAPDGSQQPIEPAGRILQPTAVGTDPYRVREEEVPRSGVRVQRVVCRSRWVDGSTHLWIARRTGSGAEQSPSGLRFDVAEQRD